MSKISIVIPTYNASSFIHRCIDSIMQQTHVDWEAIFINDGSTDNTLQILESYAQIDKRIKVFSQKNQGPGVARNTGISLAQGRYIVFVDSDDIISPNYLSLLDAHEEDLVFIDVQAVDAEGKVVRHEYMSQYVGLSKDDLLRSQMTGKINWGGVRKVVKRSIINKNNIQYTSHKIGEEAIFSYKVLYYANTISFIPTPVYSYIQRPDSQSHLSLDDPWGDVALELKNVIKAGGIYDFYANTINAFLLTAAAVSADKLAQKYTYNDYLAKIKARMQLYDKLVDKNHSIDYVHMSNKARLLSLFLLNKCYLLVWLMSKIKQLIS